MDLYPLIRPALFLFGPETAHKIAFSIPLPTSLVSLIFGGENVSDPIKVMGLQFPNRIGSAAGLDKNGKYIDALASMGFGFIEIGTTTPRSQPGNPKPRLFRLTKEESLINRMGFNNDGIEALIQNMRGKKWNGITGINIGKNVTTPIDQAIEDYLFCFQKAYAYADYISVNISSPNTENLRKLQEKARLNELLGVLKNCKKTLKSEQKRDVPIALKISPDLEEGDIRDIADLVIKHEIDAVIATNTSIRKIEPSGGLSGKLILKRSTEILKSVRKLLPEPYPIIGVGGICTAEDALEKYRAGATLLQLYSGLIYKGPRLIKDCNRAIFRARQT